MVLSQDELQSCCNSIFEGTVCFELHASHLSEIPYTTENGKKSTGLPKTATPNASSEGGLKHFCRFEARPVHFSLNSYKENLYCASYQLRYEDAAQCSCECEQIAFALSRCLGMVKFERGHRLPTGQRAPTLHLPNRQQILSGYQQLCRVNLLKFVVPLALDALSCARL